MQCGVMRKLIMISLSSISQICSSGTNDYTAVRGTWYTMIIYALAVTLHDFKKRSTPYGTNIERVMHVGHEVSKRGNLYALD